VPQAPVFDGLRAPYRFEHLVREAIHQLKYQNLRSLAKPFAGELAAYLKNNPIPADLIVPVPLHRNKLRERGYNQSELVARELGRMVGLSVDCSCLTRVLDTEPQARLGKAAHRRQNVNGAFQCQKARVFNQRVLVIDDVATSGATLNNCAISLKQAGASSVWGLAIAREV
jgi:ComF family protein